MDLKDKIIKLLEENNYTYQQLAEHLHISESQLDHALETKTLEVRTLELISKELRIPLYSFFRDPDIPMDTSKNEERYYDVNIWSDQEMRYKSEIATLKEEIQKLTAQVKNKELLVEALEDQLKKGWIK